MRIFLILYNGYVSMNMIDWCLTPTLTVFQLYHAVQWTWLFEYPHYSGTCLIRHTKGPGKCIGMYRMSEYSSFILVNRNIWDLKFLLHISYIMACISFNVFVSTNVLLNSISYYLTERICNDILYIFSYIYSIIWNNNMDI